MKARALRRVLEREPLGYTCTRQGGSHATMTSSNGYPKLLFAFHDNDTLAPGLVRTILTKQVGLAEEQARALLS